MNDTVKRLMDLADEYAAAAWASNNAPATRQALKAELVRLFTPLSDGQITQIWDKNQTTLSGWDYGGTEVINEYRFEEAVREIEAAHGITESHYIWINPHFQEVRNE